MGAQGEGGSWVYCQVWGGALGVVRMPPHARNGNAAGATDQRLEASLEIQLIETDNPHWIDRYSEISR
jgi:hypothetical protein